MKETTCATTTVVQKILTALLLLLCVELMPTLGQDTPTTVKIMMDGTIQESITSNQKDVPKATKPPIPFPRMPLKIRSLLRQQWNELDPQGEELLRDLRQVAAAMEFAHARGSFYSHLQGTFGILASWDQPKDIRRTGLVHTAYSGDLFQFYLWDSNRDDHRARVRNMLGKEAEALTFLFGTVNRGKISNLASVMNCTDELLEPLEGRVAKKNGVPTLTIDHRQYGKIEITEDQAAKLLLVTIADYLDQMVDANGWRDHHQIEHPTSLYPGDGKPALGFHWFSTVCHSIKKHLEVIPPIFNHCTSLLSRNDEVAARDAYWKVVLHERDLTVEEQIRFLQTAVARNPFIGEPHTLKSQLYFRQSMYTDAGFQARAALEKFYVLASAWDKRRSFEQWVGFSRIYLLRSNRHLMDYDYSLPVQNATNPLYANANNLKLTDLQNLVQEMEESET